MCGSSTVLASFPLGKEDLGWCPSGVVLLSLGGRREGLTSATGDLLLPCWLLHSVFERHSPASLAEFLSQPSEGPCLFAVSPRGAEVVGRQAWIVTAPAAHAARLTASLPLRVRRPRLPEDTTPPFLPGLIGLGRATSFLLSVPLLRGPRT
ncbi:hypothetical protein NDU88_006329 [Pleurodeles waltl]|uniref:Uncharacterized protein n=1 Tax=Pleurodeles waltl TaxID=8319 RepID=A0AAV7PID3_PLEWA|nr:hypothetical protein NDU88_006329 [Pleurodeles waltl]